MPHVNHVTTSDSRPHRMATKVSSAPLVSGNTSESGIADMSYAGCQRQEQHRDDDRQPAKAEHEPGDHDAKRREERTCRWH